MRRNDQPSRPNAITCSRLSLLKTWLMTTEANFPLRQLCLKPSLYGRFSLDHLWPLLGDHRGENDFAEEHVELQLAHQRRNKVAAAYNHAKYLTQRAAMMQWWADYLDAQLARGEEAGPQSKVGSLPPQKP